MNKVEKKKFTFDCKKIHFNSILALEAGRPTDDDDGCAGHQREQGEQRLLVGVDEAGQGAPRPPRPLWTSSCSKHRRGEGDKNQRRLEQGAL